MWLEGEEKYQDEGRGSEGKDFLVGGKINIERKITVERIKVLKAKIRRLRIR